MNAQNNPSLHRRGACIAQRLLFGAWLILSILAAAAMRPVDAASIALAQVPLFDTTPVLPNVLVIYDNSESMDATMSGKLVSGDSVDASGNPITRSNIGRAVMRDTITNYEKTFNWGLMSYAMQNNPPTRYNTYAYWLGGDPSPAPTSSDSPWTQTSGMDFTWACVGTSGPGTTGTTPTGQGCVEIPADQAFIYNGHTYSYVTFDKSGDDPDINDVLYAGTGTPLESLWGISSGTGTAYYIYGTHNTTYTDPLASPSDYRWKNPSAFTGNPFGGGAIAFTPTDAGFLPQNPPITRQLYLPRGWGYYSGITGGGHLYEPVLADSTSHDSNLMSLLAAETGNSTSEIKNGAVYTPLVGTLGDAKSYFSDDFGGYNSPIQYSCQKNFVMLVTDGLPTATTSGSLYSTAQRTNTFNVATGSWNFGQAAQDTINAVQALRTVTHNSNNYDIKTYVVGLGDTVANPGAVAVLNQMANVGGTGSAYMATDQTAFQNAMQSISTDIVSQNGAASSVALNTGTWSTGSILYQARFSSGDWSGALFAYPIKVDGSLGPVMFDAGQVLNSQNYDTGRNIITYKPSTAAGIPFRWPANPASPGPNSLDVSQVQALDTNISGTNDGEGAARLDYLRGSSANEGTGLNFRVRPTTKLGDIVYSSPYFVGAPAFNYPDSTESVPYSSFYTQYENREPMVYVGANDGMLHGFDGNTGEEKIAYVPSAVYDHLSNLTSPTYTHRFYVDGSPTVGDVFFSSDSKWHTVLVGGLRGGGQGYYALDVTDPSLFNESNASKLVLWEFNDYQDTDKDATMQYALGYSFSQPSIVKLATGQWGVIFGNGYDNTDADGHASTSGYAVLYILDVETGQVIAKLNTKAGSTTSPNGLATPTPVDVNGDGIVDYVYAGDLEGNMWKFDISSANTTNWGVAYGSKNSPQPLFTATDANGNPQPITERPAVGKHPKGGELVYFGTGKYLELSDNSTTSPQSFYAIWDNGAPVPGRSALQQQTVTDQVSANGGTYRVTSNTVTDYTQKQGWYLDLPDTGERQITDPILRQGRIIFTTLIPDTAPCGFGGSGYVMELDAIGGNRLMTPVFDINNDNAVNSADVVTTSSGTTAPPSGVKTVGIPTAPGILAGAGGSATSGLENKYVNLSSGKITRMLEQGAGQSQRVSWKQLK